MKFRHLFSLLALLSLLSCEPQLVPIPLDDDFSREPYDIHLRVRSDSLSLLVKPGAFYIQYQLRDKIDTILSTEATIWGHFPLSDTISILWTNEAKDTLRTLIKIDTAWFHSGVVVDDSIRISRPLGVVGQVEVRVDWGTETEMIGGEGVLLPPEQDQVVFYNEDVVNHRYQILQVMMTRWRFLLTSYYHQTNIMQYDTLSTNPVQRMIYQQYNLTDWGFTPGAWW